MKALYDGKDASKLEALEQKNMIDKLSVKAIQLEALLVTLMHAARSEEFPSGHFENACWLAASLAKGISGAAAALTLPLV